MAFDLHALDTPPAFTLSQDQTLSRMRNLILKSKELLLVAIKLSKYKRVIKNIINFTIDYFYYSLFQSVIFIDEI